MKNVTYSYKTALSKANVKTNSCGNIKWNHHKERGFATNTPLFVARSIIFFCFFCACGKCFSRERMSEWVSNFSDLSEFYFNSYVATTEWEKTHISRLTDKDLLHFSVCADKRKTKTIKCKTLVLCSAQFSLLLNRDKESLSVNSGKWDTVSKILTKIIQFFFYHFAIKPSRNLSIFSEVVVRRYSTE